MRVAGLYDIHGNLPALEAVLRDVREAGVDRIVIGGDVVPGPMPRETVARLRAIDVPVDAIHGNCEPAVLAQRAARDPEAVTYWGTVSGAPPPEPFRARMRWTAEQLGPEAEAMFAAWPRTVRLAIPGLGDVLFCHATPRSETEVFTRRTSDEKLLPIFEGLGASVVVCGHTHMQFDRMVGRTRVVNAGSVGMPFGAAGAYWVLLGPEVELRHTSYDLAGTAELVRTTAFPDADEAARSLLDPAPEAQMLEIFDKAELR